MLWLGCTYLYCEIASCFQDAMVASRTRNPRECLLLLRALHPVAIAGTRLRLTNPAPWMDPIRMGAESVPVPWPRRSLVFMTRITGAKRRSTTRMHTWRAPTKSIWADTPISESCGIELVISYSRIGDRLLLIQNFFALSFFVFYILFTLFKYSQGSTACEDALLYTTWGYWRVCSADQGQYAHQVGAALWVAC